MSKIGIILPKSKGYVKLKIANHSKAVQLEGSWCSYLHMCRLRVCWEYEMRCSSNTVFLIALAAASVQRLSNW